MRATTPRQAGGDPRPGVAVVDASFCVLPRDDREHGRPATQGLPGGVGVAPGEGARGGRMRRRFFLVSCGCGRAGEDLQRSDILLSEKKNKKVTGGHLFRCNAFSTVAKQLVRMGRIKISSW